MKDDLIFEGKKYISAKRASKLVSYTRDYVGQLCREGKVESRMVGRSRFISEESILDHKLHASKKPKNVSAVKVAPIIALPAPVVVSEVVKEVISPINTESIVSNHKVFMTMPAFSLAGAMSGVSSESLSSYSKKSFSNDSSVSINSFREIFSRDSLAASFLILVIVLNLGFMQKTFFPSILSKINIPHVSIAAATETISNENTKKMISYVQNLFGNISNKVLTYLGKGNGAYVKVEEVEPVSDSKFNGIAVAPSSGSESIDEISKQRIRDSFSDEVEVHPDASGTAGIITPVFKKASKDNYIYVLVPTVN